ncbi:MAG TPA: hypothetical protein VGG41_20120 [Solirubrobacteraceae bacterium]|jgi:hypothetical protein
MRRGLAGAAAACATAVALALALAPAASALPKLYECQHPTTTGQDAYHLVSITPARACVVVRKLAVFVDNGAKGYKLYRCAGRNATNPGHPVLVISRFDGWSLSVQSRDGLVMSRASSSFAVTGTDFPLNCT